MTKWIAIGAAAALLAGVAAASAQSPPKPGAGSPGQDQRGADQACANKTPGTPATKDAPTGRDDARRRTAHRPPRSPSAAEKDSMHQSAGDRHSRGTPKQ